MKRFVLAVSALLFVFSSASALAKGKIRLALNWKAEPEFGGFYAAEERGIFKKAGLEVEILQGGSGQPVVQMVAAGKIEFGIVSADEVLIARDKGADVVALFAVYQNHPQGIMVHASTGITSLEDVFKAGLTLAMQKGLPHATFLEKKFGFGKTKVVPYAGGVAAFLHDPKFAQQCFVTSEPSVAKASGANPKAFLIADSGYNPYATVVAVRGDRLKKEPAQVAAMMKAIAEGWDAYMKEPASTNAIMHKLNPSMDAKTFADVTNLQIPLISTAETKTQGIGTMSLERWKTLAQQLTDLKLIKKPGPVEKAFVFMH